MALDVTDPASIRVASGELDGQAIDVIINNAGVMGARGQSIGIIREEDMPPSMCST